MKFDTIIIGGGLAGLTAGIRLLEAGKRVAMVSSGQSALHFCSGSFEMLGTLPDGSHVDKPLEAVDSLPESHPYRRIGRKRLKQLAEEVKPFMEKAGLHLVGSHDRNSWRISPLGLFRPAWLTLSDHLSVESPDRLPFSKAAIINIYGYIDFYPQYLASGLHRHGVKSIISTYDTDATRLLRKSTTEMRSSTIARAMTPEAIDQMAAELNSKSADCDAILTPAVLGLYGDEDVTRLRSQVTRPVYFIPTIPANVPGVRTQLQLRERFQRLGGEYFLGDTAVRGEFKNGRLHRLYTCNLGELPIEADTFIFASGSFFSQGLMASMERIYEPVLGLDVNVRGGRTQWYDKDLYAPQPYMSSGVTVDDGFHPYLEGRAVDNVFAIGSLLGGANTLKEQSGAGVAITTALHVADSISGSGS